MSFTCAQRDVLEKSESVPERIYTRIPDQFFLCVNNLREVWLKRSPSDKTAIDIRLSEKLCSVLSIHGATVLDADSISCSSIVDLTDALTDSCTYFLSLISCSSLSCSDSPDRLVSDNSLLCLISSDVKKCDLDLLTDPINRDALLTLCKALSAADDRSDIMLESLLRRSCVSGTSLLRWSQHAGAGVSR